MLTPYINYDAFVKTQKLTLVPYYLLKYRLCLIFTHFPSDVLFCSRTMSRVPWCIYLVVTASIFSILLTVSQPFLQRRQWHPTPVFLPGKSHGWRSLVGYSPWGREELDTTERLPFHFSLSCIGEGNGNPLQCSCLENPRDGGAWWADVYGVTHSRTRLKWLSSSSSLSWSWGCEEH